MAVDHLGVQCCITATHEDTIKVWPCFPDSQQAHSNDHIGQVHAIQCTSSDLSNTQEVERPGHSLHDTVMLELDVASFTSGRQAEEAGVPPEHQGKYVGLLDRLELIR